MVSPQVDSPGRDAGARLPSPLPPLLLVLQGTRRRWRWRRRRRRRRRTRREGWAWHRAEAEAPLSLTRWLGHGIAVEGASVSADGGMKATLSVECDRGNVGSLAPAPITHCSGGERDAERIEERAPTQARDVSSKAAEIEAVAREGQHTCARVRRRRSCADGERPRRMRGELLLVSAARSRRRRTPQATRRPKNLSFLASVAGVHQETRWKK